MGTSPPSRGRCLNAGLILAVDARAGGQGRPPISGAGRPLLEQTISGQSAVTEIGRIVVVLGAHADALVTTVCFASRCAAPAGLSVAGGALEDSTISERGRPPETW